LELKAVHLALQEALHLIRGKVILVRSDNTTVISYINKQGGAHSAELCYLTWELYQWCIQYNIALKTVHIPGKKNFLADALSRGKKIRMTEWSLNNTVVNMLFQQMETPNIDLFATAQNKKLPVYCCPFPDINAFQVDSFVNKLERDVCLCISSPNSHSKSTTENSRRNEHCSSHRSNVAKTVVVSSDDRTPHRGSNKTTTVAGSIIPNHKIFHQNPEMLNLVA
jgi:hypothetical protein